MTGRSSARNFLDHLERSHPITVDVMSVKLSLRLGKPNLQVAVHSQGSEHIVLLSYVDHAFHSCIVDVGGYIRSAAIQFARTFTRAMLYTFEPSSDN